MWDYWLFWVTSWKSNRSSMNFIINLLITLPSKIQVFPFPSFFMHFFIWSNSTCWIYLRITITHWRYRLLLSICLSRITLKRPSFTRFLNLYVPWISSSSSRKIKLNLLTLLGGGSIKTSSLKIWIISITVLSLYRTNWVRVKRWRKWWEIAVLTKRWYPRSSQFSS